MAPSPATRRVADMGPQLATSRTRSHEMWSSPGGAPTVLRGSALCAAVLVSGDTAVSLGCAALVPARGEPVAGRHDG